MKKGGQSFFLLLIFFFLFYNRFFLNFAHIRFFFKFWNLIIFASLTRELFKIILFLGVKRYIFFFFFVKLKNEQFFGTSQKWNQKSKLRHPWGIVWTKNCTRSPVWIHLHFSVLTSNIYQFSQKFKFIFFCFFSKFF